MVINRSIQTHLLALVKKFPVVTIYGPRQSGKSTLVKHLFPDYSYRNLEDIESREFAKSDPKGFLLSAGDYTVLDEIQRVPELLSYIQIIVDNKNKPGIFILTGSQNMLLSESISQSLAGRTAVLSLLPFSHSELSSENIETGSLEEWLFTGGYPRIYDAHIHPRDFYPAYISTYLERDVRNIKNIGDLSRFQTFLQLCAARTGQLLNFDSLSNECGVSLNTIKSWISVLEISCVVFLLRPHYVNFSKRLIKTPKLYFYDTGLVCSLLSIQDPTVLLTHHIRGELFETAIISEVMKYFFSIGQRSPLFFWRDKTGHEIDCLIETGTKNLPVEIKSGRTIKSGFFKGINYYQNLSGCRKSILIYAGENAQQRSDALVIPWHKVSATLEKIPEIIS